MLKNNEKLMDKIVDLCKSKGYVYHSSGIYGGLANTWDYGPLGVLLKNNIKNAWFKKFVQENKYNVGLDSAILMHPQTWVASGHIGQFSDSLMDCKECKTRYRADTLIKENIEGLTNQQIIDYINEKCIVCPNCGKKNFTDIRQFNLMFKTFQGVTDNTRSELYLRPETAQGIFVNFENIQKTTRKKIPFGVAQIGKSFRNEITPGNFIFRVREFEQMELEFFCKPGTDLEWFKYWKDFCKNFLLTLNLKEENIRLRDHSPEELCFYSKATTDFEYLFPFGWGEILGIADRTDYDLNQHIKTSGKSLEYLDPMTNEKYIPYVIEPSFGLERLFLSVITEAYDEEDIIFPEKNGNIKRETRTIMRLHPALAPYKCAILPLVKRLTPKAKEIYDILSKKFMCDFDETGTIGKRYRREDEIGTPFCITIDFDTIEKDNYITVRDRDTMKQKRIAVDDIIKFIDKKTIL